MGRVGGSTALSCVEQRSSSRSSSAHTRLSSGHGAAGRCTASGTSSFFSTLPVLHPSESTELLQSSTDSTPTRSLTQADSRVGYHGFRGNFKLQSQCQWREGDGVGGSFILALQIGPRISLRQRRFQSPPHLHTITSAPWLRVHSRSLRVHTHRPTLSQPASEPEPWDSVTRSR
jgi:hypothetical protein